MSSITTGQAAVDAVRAFKAMGIPHAQAVASVIQVMTEQHVSLDAMTATLDTATLACEPKPTHGIVGQAGRDYAEMRRITGTRDGDPVPAWY